MILQHLFSFGALFISTRLIKKLGLPERNQSDYVRCLSGAPPSSSQFSSAVPVKQIIAQRCPTDPSIFEEEYDMMKEHVLCHY